MSFVAMTAHQEGLPRSLKSAQVAVYVLAVGEARNGWRGEAGGAADVHARRSGAHVAQRIPSKAHAGQGRRQQVSCLRWTDDRAAGSLRASDPRGVAGNAVSAFRRRSWDVRDLPGNGAAAGRMSTDGAVDRINVRTGQGTFPRMSTDKAD